MKENLLKNKTLGGEHTEIALGIHMKETNRRSANNAVRITAVVKA